MHDEQIREQLATWARPRGNAFPPALSVLRRRARKRIAARGAVGGLAAAAVAAVILLTGFQAPGHGVAAPVPAAPAAAQSRPPYAVLLQHGGANAAVLNMVTGKSIGRVDPPITGSAFGWIAAAGNDRTFVLNVYQGHAVRFYRLKLTASGAPGRLAALKVPPLQNSQVYGLALTADATKVAVAWLNRVAGAVTGHVSVTTLATGATRTWSSASGLPTDLSWAGDRTVAFYWSDVKVHGRSGVRLLPATTAGTNLLASRLILPASTGAPVYFSPAGPVITQDGSTVLAVRSTRTKSALVSYSAKTGKLTAVLTPAVTLGKSTSYCGVLWLGSDGRHLVFQCAAVQAVVADGRYTPIHLHQLIPAAPIGSGNTFAW